MFLYVLKTVKKKKKKIVQNLISLKIMNSMYLSERCAFETYIENLHLHKLQENFYQD